MFTTKVDKSFVKNPGAERKLNRQGRPLQFPRFQSPESREPVLNAPASPTPQNDGSDIRFRAEIESHFEDMMQSALVLPLHSAFEPILPIIFRSKSAVIWLPKPEIEGFYAPSTGKTLVGDTTFISNAAQLHKPVFGIMDEDEDTRVPSLMFPLEIKSGKVIAVAQIIRDISDVAFGDSETRVAEILMKKFTIYWSVLVSASEIANLASQFGYPNEDTNVGMYMRETLLKEFKCKSADLIMATEQIMRYDTAIGDFAVVSEGSIGIAAAALRTRNTVTVKAPKNQEAFGGSDFMSEYPAVVCVKGCDGVDVVVVLRGREGKEVFPPDDVKRLEWLMPFIAKTLVKSARVGKQQPKNVSPEQQKVTDVLEAVGAFSGVRDQAVVETIEEKAASLVGAERCKLFVYDHISSKLRTFSSEKEWIEVSNGAGFIGAAIKSGQAILSSGPENDPAFERSVDVGSDIDVKSMVVVPIFSLRNVIVGALSVMNKLNGSPFEVDDVNVLVSFAVFCGIALENARVIRQSYRLNEEICELFTLPDGNDETSILKKAQEDVSASNVTLFICREDGELVNYRSVGKETIHGSECAVESSKTKQNLSTFFTSDWKKTTPGPKQKSRPSESFTSNSGEMPPAMNPETPLVLVTDVPVFLRSKLVGVLELSVLSTEPTHDSRILERFGCIVTEALIRRCEKKITRAVSDYSELSKYMSTSEMAAFTCPPKLKNWPTNLFTLDFDITTVDHEHLLGLCFAVFDKFGLMHEFHLPALKLFMLFSRIKEETGDFWANAVESVIFLTHMLTTSRFDERLKKHEIICLLIAALCSNLDTKFSTFPLQTKNEIALNILYSKQPVFEAHNCRKTISLLHSSDVRLFEFVSDKLAEECTDLIIDLILATDYQKHFDILQEMKTVTPSENRRLIMKMILKCSQVSTAVRPEPIACKHLQTVCNEFLRQGPLGKLHGIIYKSENHSRSNIDTDRTAPIIFGRVFEPMFAALAEAMPAFEPLLVNLQSNRVKWWGQPESARSDNGNVEPSGQALGPDRLMEDD